MLASIYGFAGSESDLLTRGLISAGSLEPYKSRILLQTLLMADTTRAGIEAMFAAATNPATVTV